MLAMQSGVEQVWLGLWGEVTLDIEALTEYSGQGRCGEEERRGDAVARYREELRAWALSRNWRVDVDTDAGLIPNDFQLTARDSRLFNIMSRLNPNDTT